MREDSGFDGVCCRARGSADEAGPSPPVPPEDLAPPPARPMTFRLPDPLDLGGAGAGFCGSAGSARLFIRSRPLLPGSAAREWGTSRPVPPWGSFGMLADCSRDTTAEGAAVLAGGVMPESTWFICVAITVAI